MQRNRVVLVVVILVLVAGFFALRHYLGAEQVVRRRFSRAVEAFEHERALTVMSVVSREYRDGYGFTYETVGGYLGEVMATFEELNADVDVRSVSRSSDDMVELRAYFVVTGVYEGRRGYVVGSSGERCSFVLRWRKEDRGWMVRETDDLHIPGLEEELQRRAESRP